MSKQIQLGNGSFISRIKTEGYDEVWELQNNSLSTLEITMDTSKCTGNIEVEGFEGETSCVAEGPPMETTTLYTIHMSPPFRFAIGLSMREIPAPVEEQEEKMHDKKSGIEAEIDKMSEYLNRIPFDAMSHDEIVVKLEEFGFDHFLDPCFPPTDISLYDKESEPEYPLSQKPVWKRPHEFMKTPQLF
jgi:hypothetical protein